MVDEKGLMVDEKRLIMLAKDGDAEALALIGRQIKRRGEEGSHRALKLALELAPEGAELEYGQPLVDHYSTDGLGDLLSGWVVVLNVPWVARVSPMRAVDARLFAIKCLEPLGLKAGALDALRESARGAGKRRAMVAKNPALWFQMPVIIRLYWGTNARLWVRDLAKWCLRTSMFHAGCGTISGQRQALKDVMLAIGPSGPTITITNLCPGGAMQRESFMGVERRRG